MAVRHVLSIAEVGAGELRRLVDRSVEYASGSLRGNEPLREHVVGVYFRRTSTRTRSSFTVGALKLGARVITYGPNDLQINTGETVEDTARVLSGYCDALVVRTNDSDAEMRAFADQDEMAVVNAMSESEHPTQALADLSTLQEHFGRLEGLHVLYVGDGNNSAASLALATAQVPGMRLTVTTPEGYELSDAVQSTVERLAAEHGGAVEHRHGTDDLPQVDAVYATRWMTMGGGKSDSGWEQAFAPYSVTEELMARASKDDGTTIFMHDLPAMRGQDVTDGVLDGPQSVAFRQSRHKMYSAMSVLEWCLAEAAPR